MRCAMLLQHTHVVLLKPSWCCNQFTHHVQITQLQRKLFADTQAGDLQLLQVKIALIAVATKCIAQK